jgi:hypothetical protein
VLSLKRTRASLTGLGGVKGSVRDAVPSLGGLILGLVGDL